MLSRFNVFPVLLGHWKGLSNGQYRTYHPDWYARAILALPLVLFVVMWVFGAELAAPTPLLTAVALLAGGMLSAFTHLSALRLKVTEWIDGTTGANDEEPRFAVERDMLDETAAHLLTGSLICATDAAALVIGMNLGISADGSLSGFWAALAAALSAYVLLVFVMTLPRLYSAYVEINAVSDRLSGFSKSR